MDMTFAALTLPVPLRDELSNAPFYFPVRSVLAHT